MGNIQCAEISEIRSIDRPDGHEGRPCKRIGAAHVIYSLIALRFAFVIHIPINSILSCGGPL